MKSKMTGLTALLTLTSVFLYAADEDGPRKPGAPRRGPHGGRPEMHADVMKKFDVDGDGKLSEAERTDLRAAIKERAEKRMLERHDADGDGVLSDGEREKMREEYRARREDMARRFRGRRVEMSSELKDELLELFDTDTDGELSEEEWFDARRAYLRLQEKEKAEGPEGEKGAVNAPRDRDGQKLEKRNRNRKNQEQILKKFDADGDGKLSEDERRKAREDMARMRREGDRKPAAKRRPPDTEWEI